MKGAANTKGRRKKSSSNAPSVMVGEVDDGTQVERDEKKTTTKRRGNARNRQKTENTADGPTGKQAVRDFVLKTVTAGVPALLGEFDDIKKATQACTVPKNAFDANKEKNRYKDVFCVDESRVILSVPGGPESTDYIHANWATVSDGRKYICTQGPIEKTVGDFWRMVWQEKCKSIIMLCNVIECNKKKCEQYWPENDGDTMTQGNITIKVMSKTTYETVMTLTTMQISCGSEKLEVEHILWNNWPDRGVPTETGPVLKLILKVRRLSPSIIHCSAGIGRTGTIVCLDMMYTKLLKGECPPFKQLVIDLRNRRHGSVQTDVQYVFMHRVLIDFALQKKVCRSEEVAGWLKDYQDFCRSRGF